jgi:hypothetical protein
VSDPSWLKGDIPGIGVDITRLSTFRRNNAIAGTIVNTRVRITMTMHRIFPVQPTYLPDNDVLIFQ